MKVIEVTISPKGETTVHTKGYVGGDCLQASKFLEQALGIPVSERKTPDFYQAVNSEQQQQVQS